MALSRTTLTDPKALRGYAHPLRMKLLGLLRVHGPLTATQAAAHLGESVPNCSFHLRQLAKYGLVERAPGSDGRQRPWRATAQVTSWDADSEDPDLRAAAAALESALLGQYLERARAFLARRAGETPQWRAATQLSDALVEVTAAELVDLLAKIDALLAAYDQRRTDPSSRPPGARTISLIRMAIPVDEPAGDEPAGDEPAGDQGDGR
jgi:predicted ArsR family transcriptional regulator